MNIDKITPPEETNTDKARALIESLLGEFPFGETATKLVSLVFEYKIEKRKKVWMNHLAQAIVELYNDKLNVAELETNDKFIDAVLTVNTLAIQTSDEEKIAYYKRLIVASASDPDLTLDQQQIAISVISKLSSNQLKVLLKILSVNAQDKLKFSVRSSHKHIQSELIGEMLSLEVFFEFSTQKDFDMVLYDLHDNSYIECYVEPNSNTGRTVTTEHYLKLTPKTKLLLKLLG